MKPSLLLIDDDSDLCTMVELSLKSEYQIEIVSNAHSALQRLRDREFDIIILDWNLPDGEGVEIAKEFREQSKLTPILMLTGRQEVDNKIFGLDSGADDYLTKPFEVIELKARLHALLRGLGRKKGQDLLQVGSLTLRRSTHSVAFADKPIELTAHEFAVLELLMTYPGRSFSISSLREKLWDDESSEEAVRGCLKRLRQKLGPEASEMMRTAFGIGYSISPS